MGNEYTSTTKFAVDISELKSAMQEAKRQISIANSEFKAISSSMDNWAKSTDGLRAKLNQLDNNLKNQKVILSNLEQQYEQVSKEQGEGSAAAERLTAQINNQKAVIGNTEKQIKEYSGAMDKAEKAERIAAATGRDAADVFDELTDAEKNAGIAAENSSKGFTVMKGALANLVADGIRKAIDGLKDFAKNALDVGSNFEASMSEVSAISGATGKDLELLTETAKKYGATTQFSATEASQALKYMSLAGWDAQKSADSLGGVLSLAASSGMGLAESSDLVTAYLSAFSNTAMEASQFADMLAYAQGHANTSAQQLGEAYNNCAANLNAAGQDTYTVTALLEGLANQGTRGSEAGTKMAAIMRDLTDKMKDGKISIGDTSIAVQDAEGNFRDLTEIIKDIDVATNGMGKAQKAAALGTTFTSDSISGLNIILNEGIDKIARYEEELRNSTGAADKMAATMNDNLAGDLKSAQSALEDLYITAYKELQPTIREMVQYATANIIPTLKNEAIPAIKEIISWIVNNKDAVVAGLVAIGTGLLAFNVASMIQGVVASFKAFKAAQEGATIAQWALNAAMDANPIGIIIGLITALVAGFIYLWNTSDEFRQFWIGLWEKVKEITSEVVDAIVTFFTVTIPDGLNALCQKADEFISRLTGSVKEFFTVTIPEWFNKTCEKVKEISMKFLEIIIEYFSQLPSKIWNVFVLVVTKVVIWKNNMISKAKEIGSKFLDAIIGFFSQLPSKIWNWFTQTITKVVSFKNDMRNKAKEAASGFTQNLLEGVSGLPNKFLEIGSNIVSGIWNGIKNGWKWLTDSIKDLCGSLLKGAKDALGIHSPSRKFMELGKFVDEGFKIGIEDNASGVLKSMKNMTSNVLIGAKQTIEGNVGISGSEKPAAGNNYYFYQTNNSPKSMDRLEIYRQTKNLLGYVGS